jgi:hypothetical protein
MSGLKKTSPDHYQIATQLCGSCRFWSEMIADAINGEVQALCLNLKSPFRQKFRTAVQRCNAWKDGSHGAVDSPDGDALIALYRAEDEAEAGRVGK